MLASRFLPPVIVPLALRRASLNNWVGQQEALLFILPATGIRLFPLDIHEYGHDTSVTLIQFSVVGVVGCDH